MNSNKIIHEGEITLGETIIPCYVLEDGTRVLSGNAMQNALNLQEDTDNKSHRYLITDLGKTAYIDKHLLNKYWLFNFDFWKWFLPSLLALFGALNSIFRWVEK